MQKNAAPEIEVPVPIAPQNGDVQTSKKNLKNAVNIKMLLVGDHLGMVFC